MGEILIGTSSWADRLLLASGWYPANVNTPAGRLAYYAERFPLVEVDTSFYAIPAPETTAGWAQATPDGFTFNVKAFSLFTGHPSRAANLPPQLRPSGAGSNQRLRRRDLPEQDYDELWARFHGSLAPLDEQGKLGAVLLQFPPWVSHGETAFGRIAEAARRCHPHRVAVELRHASWFTPETAKRTLTFFAERGISFCCVDMPQGHQSSVPPILLATADPAMIRLHGHSGDWASGDKQEKFRYAYPAEELAQWADRLRELSKESDQVHVLFNNCCAGQAQRDAESLLRTL